MGCSQAGSRGRRQCSEGIRTRWVAIAGRRALCQYELGYCLFLPCNLRKVVFGLSVLMGIVIEHELYTGELSGALHLTDCLC